MEFPLAASAADILGADDLVTEDVSVPEWKLTVRVKRLDGVERDAFETELFDTNTDDGRMNRENLRARLCARAIIGQAGERLFMPEQVAALGQKSGAALDRVYEVAQRLAGLRKRDVDDLEKKSAGQPG